MNKNETRMAIESAKKEIELREIEKDIEMTLTKALTYCNVTKLIKTDDEVFTNRMQEVQAALLKIVNKLNDIAMYAMIDNDQQTYFRCENSKKMIHDTMETIRNLYM